jgi:hypothetical protein
MPLGECDAAGRTAVWRGQVKQRLEQVADWQVLRADSDPAYCALMGVCDVGAARLHWWCPPVKGWGSRELGWVVECWRE